MLIDCIKNEEDSTERVIMAIFMFFFPPLFAPLYYFNHYAPRKRKNANGAKSAYVPKE